MIRQPHNDSCLRLILCEGKSHRVESLGINGYAPDSGRVDFSGTCAS